MLWFMQVSCRCCSTHALRKYKATEIRWVMTHGQPIIILLWFIAHNAENHPVILHDRHEPWINQDLYFMNPDNQYKPKKVCPNNLRQKCDMNTFTHFFIRNFKIFESIEPRELTKNDIWPVKTTTKYYSTPLFVGNFKLKNSKQTSVCKTASKTTLGAIDGTNSPTKSGKWIELSGNVRNIK